MDIPVTPSRASRERPPSDARIARRPLSRMTLAARAGHRASTCVDAFDRLDDLPRGHGYDLRATATRRCSTGSHASASTTVGGAVLGGGESGEESRRETAWGRSPGREAGERFGCETPGSFAFATPMSKGVTATSTPRTPMLVRESPDGARLEALLAAPVKANRVERTPNATPLRLRFDNVEQVTARESNERTRKRPRGKVSDVFKATKSLTPRITRARKS